MEIKTQGDLFLELKSLLEKTTSEDYELQIKPLKEKKWVSVDSMIKRLEKEIDYTTGHGVTAVNMIMEDIIGELEEEE